jgi:Tfp pilus assembly protein PilN
MIPPHSDGQRNRQESHAGLPWRTLVVSVVIFAVTVFIYVGMAFGFEQYLNRQIAAQTQQLDQLTSGMNQAQQKTSLNFYSQLYNIGTLQKSRVDITPFFTALESHTPSGVVLTGAKLEILRGQKVQLTGTAASFDSVLASAASWRGDVQNVAGVSLDTMGTAAGALGIGKTFSMGVTFTPSAFQSSVH